MKIEVYQAIIEALKQDETISATCSGVPKGWEVSVSDCSVRDVVRDFISDLWSGGYTAGDDLDISFFLSDDGLRASYSTSPGWMAEMDFDAPHEDDFETEEEYDEEYASRWDEFVEEKSSSGTIEFTLKDGEIFYS